MSTKGFLEEEPRDLGSGSEFATNSLGVLCNLHFLSGSHFTLLSNGGEGSSRLHLCLECDLKLFIELPCKNAQNAQPEGAGHRAVAARAPLLPSHT